jgi:pimeloyl-ACP methyl ester carboxylesterase
VPLLVLSSSGDQLVDPRCSQQLAQAWQAEHRIHPNAGHDLPLDDGEWVAQRVAAWVAAGDIAAEAR